MNNKNMFNTHFANFLYIVARTDLQIWGLRAKVFFGGPLTSNQGLWLVDWLEYSCKLVG